MINLMLEVNLPKSAESALEELRFLLSLSCSDLYSGGEPLIH